jgi:hypothetical protein
MLCSVFFRVLRGELPFFAHFAPSRFLACFVVVCALAPLGAQVGPEAPSPGVIKGELRDARGQTRSFEPDVKVIALALPSDSPPFCEIVSAAWQDAFTEILEGRDAHSKIGGLKNGVAAREGFKGDVTVDGRFEMRNLPLKRRLALAARVQGLWRPFIEEIWLTQDQPVAERVIDFYTLGADVKKLRVVEHNFEIKSAVNESLKYLPITVTETIVIENPNQFMAALPAESIKGAPFIELELLKAPGWPAPLLSDLYGTELLFCQGTPAREPRAVPLDSRAVAPWMFGGGGMHGQRAQYGEGAQISLDAWHPLNADGALEFMPEGETFFRIKQDASEQDVAYLVFNRPVPPGENGKPGRLVIKLLHKCGVPYNEPGGSVNLGRALGIELQDLRLAVTPGVLVLAIRMGEHTALLGPPEASRDGLLRYAPAAHEGALVQANDRYNFSFRLDEDTQRLMQAISKNTKPVAPGKATTAEKSLAMSSIYGVLAVLFGIGFGITLLYTFRTSREVQRLHVNEAHASKHEIIEALAELERDYEKRKLPASAYVEQRRRLLARAVDLETRRGAN